MLTYDALVEQGKLRDMPSTKIRGILREYLQILILKELYKNGKAKECYFTGGTYLRLVHNLKRFSEDLDFNTKGLGVGGFEAIAKDIGVGLRRLGIRCNVDFSHWDNIFVAKLLFPEIEKQYRVVSKHTKKSGIVIKLEVYRQKWNIKSETEVMSGFGEMYPCLCTDKTVLFADKIDAFSKKERGRHLYDILFMFSNRFEINRAAFKRLCIKGNPLDVILSRVQNFSKADLKKQAEVLRPFLFDESEANLLENAHEILPKIVEKYKGYMGW
jgi:predicted nucleotidyltransferase component of viral defense system